MHVDLRKRCTKNGARAITEEGMSSTLTKNIFRTYLRKNFSFFTSMKKNFRNIKKNIFFN